MQQAAMFVAARKRAGLKQNEAARKIGMKPQQLLAIEKGRNEIGMALAAKIVAAYGRKIAFV